MITLEALQTLDAIDRNGSFSAAADELNRVPSAVSYTIQRLEDGLAVKIFDRNKQRARLTSTGKLVLKQGRQLLQAADNLCLLAKQAESGWEPRIRIMVETILPVEPLFPLIQQFNQVKPNIEVELIEESLSGGWEALADQRADLAIGAGGEPPSDLKLYQRPLGSQELVLTVAPNHPAAQAQTTIDAEQLSRYRQVIIKDSARHLTARSVGLLGGQSNLFVDHYHHKEAAILAGLGIGFLPKKRALPHIEAKRLVTLPADFLTSTDTLKIAWRQENQGKALDWFVKAIESQNPFMTLLG